MSKKNILIIIVSIIMLCTILSILVKIIAPNQVVTINVKNLDNAKLVYDTIKENSNIKFEFSTDNSGMSHLDYVETDYIVLKDNKIISGEYYSFCDASYRVINYIIKEYQVNTSDIHNQDDAINAITNIEKNEPEKLRSILTYREFN